VGEPQVSVRELPAPTYQWVLCDDGQIHAVWDDIILSWAYTGEPWTGICGRQIAMHMGRLNGCETLCWPCVDGIPPDAVQAPWPGKKL
jgi:hypothetical protein